MTMKALVLILALASLALPQTLTFSAPGAPPLPGAAVSVPVNLSSFTGKAAAALAFKVDWNLELTNVSMTIGAAGTAANKKVYCNSAKPMTCLFAGMNTDALADGVLATINATVLSTTAKPNTTLTISITPAPDAWAVDVTGSTMPLTVPAPMVLALGPSVCDPNRDGAINEADLLFVLSQNQLFTSTCTTADLNKDGRCDMKDIWMVANAAKTGSCVNPPTGP